MANSELHFTPLAITRAEGFGCVGGVTRAGQLIRPQPVSVADVEPPRAIYRYGVWYRATLRPDQATDARPEDHDLQSEVEVADEAESGAPWTCLAGVASASVQQAFQGQRSLGVVRASVERVYVTASLGGRRHLRLTFCDGSGERYDWIIPEVAFCSLAWPRVQGLELDRAWANRCVALLERTETYLSIGLTKPNWRFPGKFGGCHPLVVGLHARIDYARLLAGAGASAGDSLANSEPGG